MKADEYRKQRKALGLTQEQLADKLGITARTVIYRELGQKPICKEAELAIKSLNPEKP